MAGSPVLQSALPSVVAIFGPTASGKTAVGEAVSDLLDGDVVSADSMQAYRGLPILTAQPERPTRLVGIWPLTHEGSVAEYAHLAHAAVDELLAAGRTPVVSGGTGLYLRAAVAELELPPAPSAEQRAQWEELYDRLGPERAYGVLAARDPGAAARLHPNDRRRIVRALELTELGSSLRPAADRLWASETRRPTSIFGLDVPRDLLTERIEQRAQSMFAAGVVDEARAALAGEISSTAAQALGLRDVAELPQERALEALVVRTRRYAAYQRKWMRRIAGLVSVNADRPVDEIAHEIVEVASARQRLPAGRAG
ncbi:MAG TPA: tRNA (adenosine(37)-N6)-dimethylallyltransferase MiaA [Gaiellaceae bacterium]|nr:tRNA (adenosine(37)-N6)-dimethylallyltransferase MiaA [Gaiellaceae bacterium]